jgi:two-component system, OmpR family, sensor histidine kinase BaeS
MPTKSILAPAADDLSHLLAELLDNSTAKSPDHAQVVISAQAAADGGLLLAVEDEGIGIPPEDLPHVFVDFHQIDSSETRAYGGLGLGLAFVQRIVEAHRGQVEVVSERDEGTTLTIWLPAGRSQTAG